MRANWSGLILFSLVASVQAAAFSEQSDEAPSVLFVDGSRGSPGDGLTWASAYAELSDGFKAVQRTGSVTELHIAAGIYTPDRGTGNREVFFKVPTRDGLRILGGFPTGGGSLTDRDPQIHRTVLSGDLNGDDQVTPLPGGDSEAQTAGAPVIRGVDDNAPTVLDYSGPGLVTLDGFSVTRGISIESPNSFSFLIRGGDVRLKNIGIEQNRNGIAVRDNAGTIEFEGCVFSQNFNRGLSLFAGSIVVRDCVFRNNGRGGLFIDSNPTSVVVEQSAFISNANPGVGRDTRGGAGLSSSVPVEVSECMFDGNVSQNAGGGLWLGQGSPSVVRDCEFVNNTAAWFGGASINGDSEILDCQFIDNSAERGAGGLEVAADSSVNNCLFHNNESTLAGAGGMLTGTGVVTERCSFTMNRSTSFGGGAESIGTNAFIGCSFIGNTAAGNGGGIQGLSQLYLIGCEITDNSAGGSGGGIGLSAVRHEIVNCLITRNNSETRGGGIASESQSPVALPDEIVHCTIVANNAPVGGGIGYLVPPTISNSILWGNTDETADPISSQLGEVWSIGHSLVENGDDALGEGVRGDDPRFVDEIGPDGAGLTGDEDYRIGALSPGIDSASPADLPRDRYDLDGDGDVTEPIPFDIGFLPRVRGDGASKAVADIGAYEFTGNTGCSLADLSEPLGVVDLADMVEFIVAFSSQSVVSDIAAPFEVWSLADIIRFVEVFDADCTD